MARAAWGVTLALALAACGGDDDSTSFDAAPPVDAEPPIDAAPVTLTPR